MNLKFISKCKGPRITKTTWKKNLKIRTLTLSDFKTYHKSTVLKTVQHWYKNTEIDQWSKIESPEIDPCLQKKTNIPGGKIIQ